MTPRRLFRTLALAEAVTWTLLLAGMVLEHVLGVTELGVRVGGGLHGFAFLAYAVTVVLVGTDARWGPGRTALGLAAAFVPYATVPFARHVDRSPAHGVAGAQGWRLRTEPGTGASERLVAAALRAPLLAGAVALVGLALVFGGLLALGPPTQWVG